MVMHVDEMDATIQMMLYSDHTYTEAYAVSPTIELREKVSDACQPPSSSYKELFYLSIVAL